MLKLKKGGIIVISEWCSESRDTVDRELFPVSDRPELIHNFRSSIEVSDDFTLRDYFEMVSRYDLQNFDLFFRSFFEEYEKCKNSIPIQDEDDEDQLSYIYLEKIIEIKDAPDNKPMHNTRSFSEYINVSGMGADGETSYAIEFSPLDSLINLPIRLHNVSPHITRKDKNTNPCDYKNHDTQIIENIKCEYSFYEFLKEIIWELSFCGTPIQRDDQLSQLNASMSDVEKAIESGDMSKFSSLDDFLKEIEELENEPEK